MFQLSAAQSTCQHAAVQSDAAVTRTRVALSASLAERDELRDVIGTIAEILQDEEAASADDIEQVGKPILILLNLIVY